MPWCPWWCLHLLYPRPPVRVLANCSRWNGLSKEGIYDLLWPLWITYALWIMQCSKHFPKGNGFLHQYSGILPQKGNIFWTQMHQIKTPFKCWCNVKTWWSVRVQKKKTVQQWNRFSFFWPWAQGKPRQRRQKERELGLMSDRGQEETIKRRNKGREICKPVRFNN